MKSGTVVPETMAPRQGGVLLPVVSDSLGLAFETTERLSCRVLEDSGYERKPVSQDELALRFSQLGDWEARRLKKQGAPKSEVTALGMLTAAAQFYADQVELLHPSKLSVDRRNALTYRACSFNRRMRTYAVADRDARPDDMLTAMSAARWLIDVTADTRESEEVLERAVRGARYEVLMGVILRHGGLVREPHLKDDLNGIDLVRMWMRGWGLPIDVAASPRSVGRKCGTDEALWGINRRGILVLWPALKERQLGEWFIPDPEVTRDVYHKRIHGIIRRANDDPRIDMVPW